MQQAAQDYAEVLARWGKLSHTGPDGSEPRDRAQDAGYLGYTTVGENIASGHRDAERVIDDWMDSPGHRANILEPTYTHVGFGRASGDGPGSPYWVQKFGANGTC